MALTGSTIASTYLKLLRANSDTMGADASASYIQDSADTDSALSISTTRVGIGTAAPSAALEVKGDFKITDENSAASILDIYDDAQSGVFALGSDAKSTTYIRANGDTEFMGGNVGIGTDSPSYLTHIQSASSAGTVWDGADELVLEGSGNVGLSLKLGANQTGSIAFGDPDSIVSGLIQYITSSDTMTFSTQATARMSIDSAGDVTFTGDLIMADGKGIDFSADASPAAGMTAEILDDYEEGTWDAVVSDGTNPMTMHVDDDTGYYTKVGNLVTVTGLFSTTSLGSASGNIRITGLPFTVANNMAAYSGGVAAYGAGLDIDPIYTVTYYGQVNDTYINLTTWDATTGTSNLQASEWTANGGIIINFSYRAA